jgi:uncharacterized protein YyaL (SSP411 family)
MPNHLLQENSPYLLQHANNPVEWYPWCEEALQRATLEDKPIFLSIGYSACHWCHVMADESFEDQAIATIMNENFINIKVDREERPDLDSIYMSAVVAMTGSGGWPMSIFLTPQGQPFYGGTYFPPVRRYNMPSFKEILLTVSRLWKDDREQLLRSGAEITNHLIKNQSAQLKEEGLTPDILNQASFRLAQSYDWKHGGWGQAPKFPQPMAIEFLLRQAVRGDQMAQDIAVHALGEMAKGGMYDVVGGGFARYSTDEDWLVPHFEKMLYDNAQLAGVYLHAYLVTGDELFHRVCEETLDFIVREMMTPWQEGKPVNGGIYSSLDADSEGDEGKFYLWSLEEVQDVLRAAQIADTDQRFDWVEFFFQAYGVKEKGNFEGHTVLQRVLDDQAMAQHYGIPADEIPGVFKKMHLALLTQRSKRIRPNLDDKVLVTWNALALKAFSEAARYLKRDDYLAVARMNADFILAELYSNQRLLRSWRKGEARYNGYLEDHAAMILGLLSLYQSDPDIWWYRSAVQLARDIQERFTDPEGGFFDTGDDQEDLLFRPKDLQDNATPSGNALAAMAFLQLSRYTGDGEWHSLAEKMLERIQNLAVSHPLAFSEWLSVIDFAVGPVKEIALLGDEDDPGMQAFLGILRSQYRPNVVVASSPFPPEPNGPPLLNERLLANKKPTAYVCTGFVCQRPVITANEFSEQLDSIF